MADRFPGFRPVLLAALACVSPALGAIAQTPDTATLQGTVQDTSGAALSHAHIVAADETTGLKRQADTDDQGRFDLPGLPSGGATRVTVTAPGFTPTRATAIPLVAGTRATLQITLHVAGETSTILVSGDAGDVHVDEPQLGIDLSRRQVNDTPLPARRLTYLPLLESANRPAINQGDIFMNEDLFTTNGTGRRQTWFEVDGTNSVDMWGRQTIFANIPLMAVAQMSVLTNAFSAEYGATAGSVANLVTRSGGDRLHGQLLELWRPAAAEASLAGFTSTNAGSGNDLATDTYGGTAASLSGPLERTGRTRFFSAAEYNREAKDSPVTSPLDPGIYTGRYRGWLGFLRLDRQLSSTQNAFLTGHLDSFVDTNPNGIVGGASLPSVARIFHRRTYSTEFGDTAVLSPHLLNNARLQFQLASPITEFDPVINGTQFVVPVSSGGTFTSGTSQSALLMNRQYEASDILGTTHGRHGFVFGVDIINAHNGGNSKEFGGPLFDGRFTYKTCTQQAAICESAAYLNNIANVANYAQSYGNANYLVNDQLVAAFAQDNFRATRRLTLNAGLRYERQTLTDAELNFDPRVGFVYDANGAGSTVLRGGFGLFSSQVVDNSFASYALGEPGGVFTYTATQGQAGFPTSVAAAPLPALPPGAVPPIRSLYVRPGQAAFLNRYFPVSVLKGYPTALLNPYSEQYTFSLEQRLAPDWVLSLDFVGTHTLRILRPLDIDSPAPFTRTAPNQMRSAAVANCSRPYWVAWYSQRGTPCTAANLNPPPYSVIQTDVNDGYLHYNALDLNITHRFSHNFQSLFSYTWSHTLDNVDPDTTAQNPNDPNLTQHTEYGPAIYDQRHRLVLSGEYVAPLRIHLGGVGSFASGLPYNLVTGNTDSGDTGATTDRPVINGVVVGRNTGRGNGLYSVDPFISRQFPLVRETVQLDLRAEAFNALNHRNVVGYSGTFGEGPAPAIGFGAPLAGVTNQLPARQMQFSATLSF